MAKRAMAKRKVWGEPLFGEAKDWHGLGRFRLRRPWKVSVEPLLIATGQSLKRLLRKRGWGRRPWPNGAPSAIVVVLPLVIQSIRVRTTRWPSLSMACRFTHLRGLYRCPPEIPRD